MRNPAVRAFAIGLAACVLGGCFGYGYKPANTRLEQYDPTGGYRYTDASQHRPVGDTVVYLAFSGGGTRAAALAYGVMEELRETEISRGDTRISLLEEVDTVSGVSGGSFPAAYYGLYGDRIFEEFEPRFLKKNVQRALTLRVLNPWNLVRLLTPWLSRSDLASGYYDKHVFEGATFGTLRDARGPRVLINATDLSSGDRFAFNQEGFDLICSDLSVLPISTAVAASSAVPVVLSPIALKNYAGTCGFEPPAWLVDVTENPGSDPRRRRIAERLLALMDSDSKRFFHLVDGGVSDNLGLRATIDYVSIAGDADRARRVLGIDIPDRLVVIVVNAEKDPDPKVDLAAAAPGFASLMNQVSGGQIRHNNFETLLMVREMLRQWATDLSRGGRRVKSHMITVSFDDIGDEKERQYFKRLPTSFTLSDEEVDGLREVGRRLLRASPDFQALVKALQ